AGVTACTRQPPEKIVPYVRQPEELIPGKPLFFATAMPLGGSATGLLVESHEDRPTKIEGNPQHPGSVGASDVFAQAAILGLYDPDRSQTLTNIGEIRPWSAFLGTIRARLTAQQALNGGGMRILTESVNSVRIRMPPPFSACCAVSRARMVPRKADQGRISPMFVSVCERSGSYRPRIAAWAKTSDAPTLPGCCGLPSI